MRRRRFPSYIRYAASRFAVSAAPAINWWEIEGNTPVAAYQAIGADDLADSYINLVNPGTNDAAPGTAPTWSSAGGWSFTEAQYLVTGVTPNRNYSMLVRHSNRTDESTERAMCGMFNPVPATTYFALFTDTDIGMTFGNSGIVSATMPASAGVAAICGGKSYFDGSPQGDIPLDEETYNADIYLGAMNAFSSPQSGMDVDIQAVAIYSNALSLFDQSVIYLRMALLTG